MASKDVTSCVGEKGRWPANVIHDGSDEVVSLFPNSEGGGYPQKINGNSPISFRGNEEREERINIGDCGSAARFFYTAKAQRGERDMGLYDAEEERHADRNIDDGVGGDNPRNRTNNPRKNFHPTVKPLDLMRYLVRLITPKGGIVLDPYLGSGTTAVAAKLEGMQYIGMEREPQYVLIAEGRVKECESDYETKAEMYENPEVKQVYDIFDYLTESPKRGEEKE
jgi:site-specific DNA-methyltransferase (adenine-specific)